MHQPPQDSMNDDEMRVLQQLLAAESAKTEAAITHQSGAGLLSSPAVAAELMRSQLVPSQPTQAPAAQQAKQPPYIVLAGMACTTALIMTAIIAASLPGARGTAEINTAVMALADASQTIAENQKRPNEICISFWCGGSNQRNKDEVPEVQAAATTSPYQEGIALAQEVYAPVVDSPMHIEAAIAKLREAHASALTNDEKLNIEGQLSYLRGLL